ncbi:hypothetical protein EVAR_102808_1 [Eumeta japonica]|uniref:Uncharacterized protein n=1 Tax=Eumeta variegata TaxID=151549 RepID=A0A4C1TLE7_EUMVA|nr:hypothetical protein EVAR_102808_1 [Eumeta japonica]
MMCPAPERHNVLKRLGGLSHCAICVSVSSISYVDILLHRRCTRTDPIRLIARVWDEEEKVLSVGLKLLIASTGEAYSTIAINLSAGFSRGTTLIRVPKKLRLGRVGTDRPYTGLSDEPTKFLSSHCRAVDFI